MTYDDFTTLHVRARDGVAWVSIDHPPVNVSDAALGADLARFAAAVATDGAVRMIVLQSANQDYFAAHADLAWMWAATSLMALADPEGEPGLNPLQQLNERLRTLPQVTIAKLRGRLRAGGAELAMTADMRFAAAGRTWLAQPETRMGIFPGGGTQYLNRLVGRSRAGDRAGGRAVPRRSGRALRLGQPGAPRRRARRLRRRAGPSHRRAARRGRRGRQGRDRRRRGQRPGAPPGRGGRGAHSGTSRRRAAPGATPLPDTPEAPWS